VQASFPLSESLSVLDVSRSRGNSPQSLSGSFLEILWQKDVSYIVANENTGLIRFIPISFAEGVIINLQGPLKEELERALMGSGLIIDLGFT
jgi:hypothetical protein